MSPLSPLRKLEVSLRKLDIGNQQQTLGPYKKHLHLPHGGNKGNPLPLAFPSTFYHYQK